MSINLLLENDSDPVVWRGPVIAGAVKQFWTDVIWNDVDYMFVDMPPGTGDVPLTVFQSLPLDGIVVVTSPQQLVEMIVGKAVKMANLVNVPVLGIVENMSYYTCPDCGKRHSIFGESDVDKFAADYVSDGGIRIKFLLKVFLAFGTIFRAGRTIVSTFRHNFLLCKRLRALLSTPCSRLLVYYVNSIPLSPK